MKAEENRKIEHNEIIGGNRIFEILLLYNKFKLFLFFKLLNSFEQIVFTLTEDPN